ncbi:hypothetical protein ACKKBG_A21250 [Auxenochlorella protothecoides x Auxenochlorella symbiontica]
MGRACTAPRRNSSGCLSRRRPWCASLRGSATRRRCWPGTSSARATFARATPGSPVPHQVAEAGQGCGDHDLPCVRLRAGHPSLGGPRLQPFFTTIPPPCTGVVVAVVGCGPVGLLAATAAGRFPAVRAVLAIDSVPGRLALAGRLGATPVNSAECDPIVAVREATGGQGADVVLEVVGAGPALGLALDLLKPGGIVSSVGCHTDPGFPFTPADLYNKNATLASGRCPARSCLEELLPALAKGELGESTAIITHRLPLLDGVRAYEAFEQRLEGWVKVVFDPWTGGKPASESV